jgi:hypothetical protein
MTSIRNGKGGNHSAFLFINFICHTNNLRPHQQFAASTATAAMIASRVDTKWRFQFFAKYDYRFLLDVIIAIIATFFAKAIIVISRLLLSISLE